MGTSTIKSSGGDYTSLSAWEADKNGNIIGLGPEIAECYDVDDTTDVAISGWATSASDYIEIKAVTAARCNGSTRAQTGNTYRLSSAINGVLRNSQSHVRINGIEIKCTTGGIAFQQVGAASGSDVRVEDCVLSSNDVSASTSYTVSVSTAALNLQLTNCIITGKRRGIDCRSSFTVTVDHCTIYTDAADLGIVADTELTCTNTYVGGHSTQDFWTGGAAPSGSNNASSDTSASTDYTSSLTSKTASNQFTSPSITDSSWDFTLKATADLIGAGTGSYATDIAGNTRTATVDIGAFEYVTAGGSATVVSTQASQTAAVSASATAPTFSATVASTQANQTAAVAANATAPTFSATVAATQSSQTATGSASATEPGFDASVTATQTAQTATAAASTTAPTFSATIASTQNAQSAAVSANATEPGFGATVAATQASQTATLSASTVAPNFDATVTATQAAQSSELTSSSTEPGTAGIVSTQAAQTAAISASSAAPQFAGNVVSFQAAQTATAAADSTEPGSATVEATQSAQSAAVSASATAPAYTAEIVSMQAAQIALAHASNGHTVAAQKRIFTVDVRPLEFEVITRRKIFGSDA